MDELAIILIGSVIFTALLAVTLVFLETMVNPSDRRYLATQIKSLWSHLYGARSKPTRD